MLSILRRLINSRFGAVVAMAGLVLIALAFALGDVTGLRNSTFGPSATGDTIATVGKVAISPDDLRRRVEGEFEGYRQQQPDLTMAQFVAGGGFDSTLDRYIDNLALQQFGTRHGIVVGKKAVDGQIASIPQFKGPNGKFDPKLFNQVLAAQHLTVSQFRDDVTRVTINQQLTAPTLGATQVPDKLALPYASLLLEKRAGAIGFVPNAAMPKGTPPSDQEITAFYKANIARYSVPERRSIRYALVTPDAMKAGAAPGEAEIAAAYKAKAAQYGAHELRSVSQVVVGDKAAADALVAKVKGGAAIDAAARATGLEAARLAKLDKDAYAAQTSAETANAVFAAADGAVVGPLKAPLGWMVAHVDAVEQQGAKSLDQVRPDLVKELTDQKVTQKLLDIRRKIDAALNNNATFDEIVGGLKLAGVTTPPLLADGRDPAKPDAAPDPNLAQVVSAGFAANQGDAPQMVAVGTDGGFAVVGLDRITSAAPAPLAEVKAKVAADIVNQRTGAAARKLANDLIAKVNGGMPLAEAIAKAGVPLPPTKPIAASRAQLAASQGRVPPPLALMFAIKARSARVLPSPQGDGWFIVYLDSITRGDASGQPGVVMAMRNDMGHSVGGEYVGQLALAARREVGVNKNGPAIAKLRQQLLGNSQQP